MQDINRFTGDNIGGNLEVNFIPVSDVMSIPAAVNHVVGSNVVLKAGKTWFSAYFTEGTCSVKEPMKILENGQSFQPVVECFLPKDEAPNKNNLFEMSLHRFILHVKDQNGKEKLYGSLEAPLSFSFKLDTKDETSGRNGHVLRWESESGQNHASYFYTPSEESASVSESVSESLSASPSASPSGSLPDVLWTHSLDLDGSNERVGWATYAALEALNGTVPCSWEGWVKFPALGSAEEIWSKDDGASNGWIIRKQGGNQLRITLQSGVGDITVRTSAAAFTVTNQWYHFVITYDGSTNASGITIYIDGSPVADTDINDAFVGSMNNVTSMYQGFNGSALYGQFRMGASVIHDQELSAAQVTTRYNSGSWADPLKQTGIKDNLVFGHNSTTGSGTTAEFTIADFTGNAADGVTENCEDSDRVADAA